MRPKVRARSCLLPPPPAPQPSTAAACCRHAVHHRRPVRGLGCACCAGGFLGRVVIPRLRPGPGSRRSARAKGESAPSEDGALPCGTVRLAAQTGPAALPLVKALRALRVKPPGMRGQPVAVASPPSTGWFRCGEPSQWHAPLRAALVARLVQHRPSEAPLLLPLRTGCLQGAERAPGGGSVAESVARLPSGPPAWRPEAACAAEAAS